MSRCGGECKHGRRRSFCWQYLVCSNAETSSSGEVAQPVRQKQKLSEALDTRHWVLDIRTDLCSGLFLKEEIKSPLMGEDTSLSLFTAHLHHSIEVPEIRESSGAVSEIRMKKLAWKQWYLVWERPWLHQSKLGVDTWFPTLDIGLLKRNSKMLYIVI